ncbi:MAG: hypothetical protein ABIM21_00200 [candidate division WOR-3 bacterium]
MIIMLLFIMCKPPMVEIPDSILYKPPEKVFLDHTVAFHESGKKVIQLVSSFYSVSLLTPLLNWRVNMRPSLENDKMKSGVISMDFKRGTLEVFFHSKFRVFQEFATQEDTCGLMLAGEKAFMTIEFRNSTDFFPGIEARRFNMYTVGYFSLGWKFGNLSIFSVIKRIERRHDWGIGLAYFAPFFSIGMEAEKSGINSITFSSKIENFQFNFVVDNEPSYGDFVSFDLLRIHSIPFFRSLSRCRNTRITVGLTPFYVSFNERKLSKALRPNQLTYELASLSDFVERSYEFGLTTESFTFFYAHFDSPYRMLKDTLQIEVALKQKYYDLVGIWTWRRHEESIFLANLELLFNVFRDFNPYVRVNNLFNSAGCYLPSLKVKRRYVEIGAIFKKEF